MREEIHQVRLTAPIASTRCNFLIIQARSQFLCYREEISIDIERARCSAYATVSFFDYSCRSPLLDKFRSDTRLHWRLLYATPGVVPQENFEARGCRVLRSEITHSVS